MKAPSNERHGEPPRSRQVASGPQDPEIVVPVAREDLKVLRRRRTTGTVRVTKTIGERLEVVDEPTIHEDVVVERTPTDRVVDAPPPPREEGDTLVLSVVAEVLVKQLRVVEEVRITRRRRVERQPSTVSLRTERVDVERQPGTRPAGDRDSGNACWTDRDQPSEHRTT
jgi:stress response protein YsnF